MTTTQENGTLPAVRQQPAKAPVPVPLARPLTDLDQAWRAAGILARGGLLPKALYSNRSPEQTQANVALILWYGAELGISPVQALQEIYVVHGRPQISGRLWLAKLREAGHLVSVVEHTTKVCTIKIVRGDTGEEHTETFTWEDAGLAKLTGKDTYRQHPKRMLLWRCAANAATIIAPEVAMGFGAEPPEEGQQQNPGAALAEAVDVRTPSAEPESADVRDAEVVEDQPAEPEQDDEERRQEVLNIAAEFTGKPDDEDDGWPPARRPGSGDGA